MHDTRFAFGRNWQQFIERNYSQQRLDDAKGKLLDLLGLSSLQGLSFLDIGSGSGLHSLAALQAGAARIHSFDYDEHSVATSKKLRELAGKPAQWVVEQGSVLDQAYMRALPKFDVVYSWGVLHHTGNMWQAIENATIPLSGNGLLSLALYSETRYRNGTLQGHPSPEQWLKIKQAYNRQPWPGKRLMELRHLYRSYWAGNMPNLWAGWQKLRAAHRRYQSNQRGMEFWTDMRDWLGGWPMEFIEDRQCYSFMHKLGLIPLKVINGQGNTEFLFRPAKAHNAWDKIVAQRKFTVLQPPFKHEDGHMFSCELPANYNVEFVWENDILLGFMDAPLPAIELFGKGRYCIENRKLFFASSDNSDPNTSGYKFKLSYYDD